MLGDKYPSSELVLKNLQTKDALVAASLGEFCAESNGMFELFVCPTKFTWGTEVAAMRGWSHDETEPRLKLRTPWMPYSSQYEARNRARLATDDGAHVVGTAGRSDSAWLL